MDTLLSQRTIDQLPEIVKRSVRDMSDENRYYFESHYRKRKMTAGPLVLLAIFFPIQLFILGKLGLGLIFWLTAGGFFVWWFIEIFLTVPRVQQYNQDLAISIVKDMRAMGLTAA